MGEFDNPGIFFFDPQDPSTVDLAWQRLEAATPVTIPQAGLDELYNWDLVARTLLEAHARNGRRGRWQPPRSLRPSFSGAGSGAGGGTLLPSRGPGAGESGAPLASSGRSATGSGSNCSEPSPLAATGALGGTAANLVTTLLARDPDNDYVLYCQEGLPTDQIPNGPQRRRPSAATRPGSRRDDSGPRYGVADGDQSRRPRRALAVNPLELALGFDLPAKPLNGLKMAAVVYDLIPLIFQEEYFPLWPGPEFVGRYLQGLNRLRSYDALLAISEATRSDFLSLLGLPPDRVVTIGTASDGQFFVPDRTDPMSAESRSLLRVLGITRPFVFSVGAVDYRKNPWGLIDAFAMLPVDLRRAHQLVLCYGLVGGGPRPGAAVRPGPRRRRPVGGDRLDLGQGVAGLVSAVRGVRLPLVV